MVQLKRGKFHWNIQHTYAMFSLSNYTSYKLDLNANIFVYNGGLFKSYIPFRNYVKNKKHIMGIIHINLQKGCINRSFLQEMVLHWLTVNYV